MSRDDCGEARLDQPREFESWIEADGARWRWVTNCGRGSTRGRAGWLPNLLGSVIGPRCLSEALDPLTAEWAERLRQDGIEIREGPPRPSGKHGASDLAGMGIAGAYVKDTPAARERFVGLAET